jgi:hypothetical protein
MRTVNLERMCAVEIGEPSTPGGPDIGVCFRVREELRLDECGQDRGTAGMVEPPEPSAFLLRDAKAGHFVVLGTNTNQ